MLDNPTDGGITHENNNKDALFLQWFNPFSPSKPKPTDPKPPNTKPNAEIIHNEYQGIQSLKHFWNSRISAIKEVKFKSATLNGSESSYRKTSPSKVSASQSVSCLLTSAVDANGNPQLSRADRSLSFCVERRLHTHVPADNFYKYKTAPVGCGKHPANQTIPNFPLVARSDHGEKIHWAKRDDIVIANKRMSQNSENNESDANADSKQKITSPDKTADNSSLPSAVPTPTPNSSMNSLLSSDSPVRRKNSSATRRYSFKTNSSKHHYSRKMTSAAGGSKVATLTQKFNEMIQKDAGFLTEVRKKNGVLISRAGHVYKVREEKSPKKTDSESKFVKDAIKKFEGVEQPAVDASVAAKKPKVPVKSPQVLQRTKEFVNQRKLKSALSEVMEEVRAEDVLDAPDNDDADKADKKSRYAKIYEKIRYRSPFGTKKKPKREEPVAIPEEAVLAEDTGDNQEAVAVAEDRSNVQDAVAECSNDIHEADRKIVEAIENVNRRIETLSRQISQPEEITLTDECDVPTLVPPNESFLFPMTAGKSPAVVTTPTKDVSLVEAINLELVKRSEPQPPTIAYEEEDELYEPILVNRTYSEGAFVHLKQPAFATVATPRVEDYEPSDYYESIEHEGAALEQEDGYEICEPPEPPPPRNTTDELPALPLPKRSSSHVPPRPAKLSKLPEVPSTHLTNDYQVENIYDTIKSPSRPKFFDAISIVSNCYESINSYKRPALQKTGSSSTISSDQKTNSLYGMSIEGPRDSAHSLNGGSSENSDDWVDISDIDESSGRAQGKQQFIVVRERTKCHRSPDWSKRVRDKRLHQTNEYFDDDSDNYYESLYPPEEGITVTTSTPKYPNTTPKAANTPPVSSSEKSKAQQSIENMFTEDYDSFDTEYESEGEETKKDDSGVDISNTKLPDPPAATNQVYAALKKFRNFVTMSKKTSKSSKSLDGIGKSYENTQFYVGTHEYNNVDASQPKNAKKATKAGMRSKASSEDLYENTEFHTPIAVDGPSDFSQSEKNLSESANDLAARKKSKSGKSFKSKIRRSLVGGGLSTSDLSARSTFYVSDTAELDSGIFEKPAKAEENEYSELPTTASTVVRKPKPKTVDPNRRKTTIGIRPNDPPPPPPAAADQKKKATASWYAECGVFKPGSNDEKAERSSNTSWYAEAGLYQTSDVSVVSSSGSSGVSTGGDRGAGEDNSHSMFLNEPLYQIYSAAKLESISHDMEDQESADGYEEIGSHRTRKQSRPSALQLVGPKQGPSRTLWSEIPEVINSHVLLTLTPTERRLQEAKFEILTSEASYLKSLNLLQAHFMNHPAFRDTAVLSLAEQRTLFSYIVPVHECSDKLLSDMESCWQDNIMLLGLSKKVYKNAERYFKVYIEFCEHQGEMDRTLRRLKEAKGNAFSQILEKLEADPMCCGLNLHSFLMLPMQRITRLPLLIDGVFSKVMPDDDEYEGWKMALSILNKIVAECNEAANRSEQAYEIEKLSRQIEFPSNIRAVAIAPVGVPVVGAKKRSLVRRGELIHIVWRGDDTKLTFGKKFSKCKIFAFLFTDILFLTKRKGPEQYVVFDYCARNLLTVTSGDAVPQLPTKELHQNGKNLILLTLLENYDKKTVEMVLSCSSVSEQERWLQATAAPEAETPGEKLYEAWDCPQVTVKHHFVANEPDLLGLEPGDVVNVTRKLPDGWFHGERIRDGNAGWFPGSFVEEVNSAHVRARNLKQRYRLLTFTASYLESQKKK